MQCVKLGFDVDGENFSSAGNASESVKRTLKQIGIAPASVRRVAIAMYEGEINMVIHAHGGRAASENIRSLGFGAGMGLPNMKKYSDEMRIDSTVGVGTTVFLRVNF